MTMPAGRTYRGKLRSVEQLSQPADIAEAIQGIGPALLRGCGIAEPGAQLIPQLTPVTPGIPPRSHVVRIP
jgi:hypothetical protein